MHKNDQLSAALSDLKKNKVRCILGIDPGTVVMGFGVIRVNERRHFSAIDYGCVRPPPTKSLSERYRIIYKALEELIQKYAPEAIAVETQYIHKNPQTGLKLGMARGVVMLAAALHEVPIPLFEYAPTRVKRAVVGTGKASKEQVQAMVQRLLCLSRLPEPEDAADALAIAICHGQNADQRVHDHV